LTLIELKGTHSYDTIRYDIVIAIVKTLCNAHKVNAKHRIGGAVKYENI